MYLKIPQGILVFFQSFSHRYPGYLAVRTPCQNGDFWNVVPFTLLPPEAYHITMFAFSPHSPPYFC